MRTRIVFEAQFDTGRSAHRCEVHIHSSEAAMRRIAKRVHKILDSGHTEAFCSMAGNPGRDRVVSEIHVPRTRCGVKWSLIVHEAVHASFHRCYLLGMQFNDPNFEEHLALGTEYLSSNIVKILGQKRIKVIGLP